MPNTVPYTMGLQKILSHLFEKNQVHRKITDALRCYSGQMPALTVWPLLYARQKQIQDFSSTLIGAYLGTKQVHYITSKLSKSDVMPLFDPKLVSIFLHLNTQNTPRP